MRVTGSHADGQYGARRRSCEQAAQALDVRFLAEVDDSDAALARLEGDDEAETALLRRRVRHAVTRTARVHQAVELLRETVAAGHAGRYRRLAELLDASRASRRGDCKASCPELDVVVEAPGPPGPWGPG